MSRKKIYILSQLFFPANTPRANRAFELAKEFARRSEYDVVVYCIVGKYDYRDVERTYSFKVRDLGPICFSNISPEYQGYDYLLTRIIRKFFGRILHFPEIELSYHVYRVLRKETNIDALISIAVPYPIHWGVAVARQFNRKLKIKTWIADCGDPFMGNPIVQHPFYFRSVEKWFSKRADFITIPIEDARNAYYKEFQGKIKVIPQGFEFKTIDSNYAKNIIPTFIYSGIFYENVRDPRNMLEFLSNLEQPFKFVVYTKTPELLYPYVERLGNKLVIHSYIERAELLRELSKADFLINIENNTVLQSPSKLIDYALSGRPILNIKSNKMLDTESLLLFLAGNYSNKLIIGDIERYNIVNVVDDFIKLFNQ
ncbi:MAG: hypothetical protein L6264_11705 [Weeksellaceae bacterium]|nr:hypothetical protein [Bacteroidota bacterium]MCG2781603.1 hypothetical protein [Weeksellaceae bacterium]